MKEKNLKISVISLLVALLLLLQVKLFYILPFSGFYSINSNQQQLLMVLITIATLIATNLRPISGEYHSVFNKEIVFFLLYYVFELIYSAIKNKQGIVNAFTASNFYLMIISFYIYSYYIKKNGLRRFDDIVITIATINIVVCWLQYFLAFHGIVFTKMQLSGTRFDSVRIQDMGETITCLGIILAANRWIFHSSSKRGKYIIITFLGILGNLIVSKGRITIIALISALVIMLMVKHRKNVLSTATILCAVFVVVALFFKTPLGEKYITSFTNSESDTATIRSREYSYYLDQSEESVSNLIFGVGFIRDTGDEASNYLRGPAHQYSRTDIGFLGMLNSIGILGCIWYCVLLIKSLVILVSRRKKISKQLFSFILAFLAFHVVYLPTMATLNPFSITSFVLLLCYVEYSTSVEQPMENKTSTESLV